ncbi:hypothetical protein, partial [Hymenobacter algoricola]|uniref:hypothetical protein n=1 Tax=Hymenobacter algoricola TaxID=486267 RepID=UPI0031ECCDAE
RGLKKRVGWGVGKEEKGNLPLQPASTGSWRRKTETRKERKTFSVPNLEKEKSFLPLQPASIGRGAHNRKTRVGRKKEANFFLRVVKSFLPLQPASTEGV